MSKTRIAAATPRARKTLTSEKVAAVRKSTVVLFGSKSDPEMKESIRRAEISGRGTEMMPRPNFDTGIGMCGKHLCNCKSVCKKEFAIVKPLEQVGQGY